MTVPLTPAPRPLPPPTFVLGYDVASSWGVPVARPFYTSAVLTRLLKTAAVVPEYWFFQVAEVIRTAAVSGRVTATEAPDFLAGIWDLPIHLDAETRARVATHTLPLALAHAIPIECAAYLELCSRLNLPLATTDATLIRAAGAAGIPIFAS